MPVAILVELSSFSSIAVKMRLSCLMAFPNTAGLICPSTNQSTCSNPSPNQYYATTSSYATSSYATCSYATRSYATSSYATSSYATYSH
jgi:hypothetical protein